MRKVYRRPQADTVVFAAQDILMESNGNGSIGGGVELPPIGETTAIELFPISLVDDSGG